MTLVEQYLAWPMKSLETTREQVAEFRASFDAAEALVVPCCGGPPQTTPTALGDSPASAFSSWRSFATHSPRAPPEHTPKTMVEDTSVETASTLEESTGSCSQPHEDNSRSSSSQSEILPVTMENSKPEKRSRKRRPRRRVCLLENCNCPYHEERTTTEGSIDSILTDLKSQQRGENSESSSSTDDSEVTSPLLTTSSRSDEDDCHPLQETPRVESTPKDCYIAHDTFWNAVDGIVFDETDISRGLAGYQEGCEPEVIAQYTVLDVQRWELESADQQNKKEDEDTLQLLSSHSYTSHSRGESRASRGSGSRLSSSHHSNPSSSSQSKSRASRSTYYPSEIPASAAEV